MPPIALICIQTNSQRTGHTRKVFVTKEDLLDSQAHLVQHTHQKLLTSPCAFCVLDVVYNHHRIVGNSSMKPICLKVYVTIEHSVVSYNHTYKIN